MALKAWRIESLRRKRKKQTKTLQLYGGLLISSPGKNTELQLRGSGRGYYLRIKQKKVGWFVFLKACEHASVITTPPSMAAWPAHYWLCPPHLLCSSSSYLAPSPPLPAFITSPPPFFICPLFTVSLWPISCRWCDLYFLLNCVYHFKHLWEKRRGGGFVISFSQMILAPVLSSVWIKRFEWPFFQGSWYPAGGSINWAHFSQPTLQGRPPLKRSRRKKNLRIITNVTHIAIRLHLSHIDNRHFSSPRGSKWNYGRAYVTL